MKTSSTLPAGSERLERAIAHRGLASRREAKALIVAGKVRVNTVVVTEPGYGIVLDRDVIEIADTQAKESYLVYKTRGIETTKTSPGTKDLHDQFPTLRHLAPIGRLDKDSEGLIIMTNDGTLTKSLTRVGSSVGKTYRVVVRESVPDTALLRMAEGIVLDKVKTKPAEVSRGSRTSLLITLHEGRKHQIRRMCDACKLTIESLTRIAIGHLTLGMMKPGTIKKLRTGDTAQLKA